jgi:hypothetical protein
MDSCEWKKLIINLVHIVIQQKELGYLIIIFHINYLGHASQVQPFVFATNWFEKSAHRKRIKSQNYGGSPK